MTQATLPLFSPGDRGRLNALRNIVAAISDELRQQAPVAQGIVEFAVQGFPPILLSHAPLNLLSADPTNPTSISPYPFDRLDLINAPRSKDVFSSVAELASQLDITTLAAPLQNVELIGVDESIVDTPLPQSTFALLKSVAFRMYKMPGGEMDEAAGPILSEMRMQLREDESFENENKLLGYIRNHYVAYISSLFSLSDGRKPFVVLHGPLVRAIGGFSSITFDYKTVHDLLNIDLVESGEMQLPAKSNQSPIIPDVNVTTNMPLEPINATKADKNLRRFNEFCLNTCGRKCDQARVFDPKAIPPDQLSVDTKMIKNRDYPGFCLYFWMLRSLFDLSRLAQLTTASVVEDVSAATEMMRIVLPSLLANPAVRRDITRSSLNSALKVANIVYPATASRSSIYKQAKDTIESFRLTDSNMFSYVLAEGQYTAPVQIYRYRTRNKFIETLNDRSLGIDNSLEPILDKLFPDEVAGGLHPGYRILMSYVRTSPLREPIRVEYFDHEHLYPAKNVIGPIFLLSLPYQEYGIPIILYYADKLARTPTRLVRTIIEREYLEILQNSFTDPVTIMRVLGKLSRGYFQREGFQS